MIMSPSPSFLPPPATRRVRSDVESSHPVMKMNVDSFLRMTPMSEGVVMLRRPTLRISGFHLLSELVSLDTK